MKRSLPILLAALSGCIVLRAAQTTSANATRWYDAFSLSGFFFHGAYWDNRQIIGTRDGVELHLPLPYRDDILGRDINHHGELGGNPLFSRIDVRTHDVPLWQGVSWLFLQSDFYGSFDEQRGNFRMRQLYCCYDTSTLFVLLGYADHPASYPVLFPNTVSSATGTPLTVSMQSPQLLFRYSSHDMHCTVAALTELFSLSTGPYGYSTQYIRNALVPNLHLQISRDITPSLCIGGALDYKRLVPRLVSDTGFKVNESINSFSWFGYLFCKNDDVQWCSKFSYIQNGDDLDVIGGYAVNSISPITAAYTYTPLNLVSWWFDCSRSGRIEPGIFVAVVKNQGASSSIIPFIENDKDERISLVYGFATDLDMTVRVSSRIRLHYDSLTIGCECEYNYASWGTLAASGKVVNSRGVHNIRFLCAAEYRF